MLRAHAGTLALAAGILVGFSACNSSSSNNTPALTPQGKIAGEVTVTGGAGLDEYVVLQFMPTGGGTPTSVTTDKSGAYTVDLASGEYDVTVSRPGYEQTTKTGLALGTGTLAASFELDALPPNTYIGSAGCGVCHDSVYQTFRQNGHLYKLNKVNGAAPEYPYSTLAGVEALIGDDDTKTGDPKAGTDNTLGTPASWDDITYVIGGYYWKARFIDKNGYIVTGSKVQYNFKTNAMASYHDNETDKPYNCGNCHTTGWKHYDPVVNDARQDGLPGMHGTFAEPGIGCEACHGAGSTHAQTGLANDTTRRAQPRSTADFNDGKFAYGKAIACGECHTRDGERDYNSDPKLAYLSAFDKARLAANKPVLPQGGRINAKGGLVRHHEQYDEVLGINPDTMESVRTRAFTFVHGNCIVCHDPHKTAVNRGQPNASPGGVDASNDGCLKCHEASYAPKNNIRPYGSMKNLNCIDCHMPKLAKSATNRVQPNGVVEGDVTSHVFSIKIGAPQFTKDGKYSYPWLSFDFSCRNCHGDETFDILGPLPSFNYHPDK